MSRRSASEPRPHARRQRPDSPESENQWIGWAIATLYAATYSILGMLRYRSYHAGCDEGLFLQSISSAFHGFRNTPEGASHFAYHFSPILYVLAFPVWIWKSAVVLIVAQAVAGSLTIPPIYRIARGRLPTLPSALVTVVAALYPPLGGVSFTDFSENAFAPAAVAWLLWAIDARKMVPAIVSALVCLSIKEDQAITLALVGFAGGAYFYQRKDRKWALYSLSLACISILVFAFYLKVVRPASGVWYGYPSFRDFYGGVNPIPLIPSLFTAPKLAYLLTALLPLLGICLLSRCMILAIPGLLECLLSKVPVAYTIGEHYPAIWVPYVLVAFAIGASVVWRRSSRAAYEALALAVAVGLYINILASPNQWSGSISPETSDQNMLDRFEARLPVAASVTSFCWVYAHLGMHPNATVYAQSPTRFVIIYSGRDSPDWVSKERVYVAGSRKYHTIEKTDGLEIYER